MTKLKGLLYLAIQLIGYSNIAMQIFLKYSFILATLVVVSGCKQKKQLSLAGDEPIAVNEFIEFFNPLELTFEYADSSLIKAVKESDSLLISNKIFSKLVPDSVLSKIYGKSQHTKIYVLGKVVVPKEETYLFVRTISKENKAVIILAFDKDQQFIAALPALIPDGKSATEQTVSIDRRYTITKKVILKNTDGSVNEGRDVYVLNKEAKNFMLIMTDPLTDKVTELINPIDTLLRESKYAADYTNGKMNLVSIRDSRKKDHVSFFIHFEKSNGKCTGELKGEAKMKTANTAIYQESGEPCQLQFIFSSSSVTLKEIEGCGSKRPFNCSFDGSFSKKKVSKSVNKSP